MSDLYDDGGRGRSTPVGPSQLPAGDPRLNGFPDTPAVLTGLTPGIVANSWNEYGPEVHSFGAGARWAPQPDPRVANGFGHAPARETIPVERHPAGEAKGRGGQFR
jgi:hypothetical protein